MSLTVTASRRGRPAKSFDTNANDPIVNEAYRNSLGRFLEILSRDNSKAVLAGKSASTEVKFYQVQGRKFDRIVRTVGPKSGPGRRSTVVMYFVENSTGKIYGPKSEQAPNFRRFYGNIDNAEKWDWTGEPRNLSDESVKETGKSYGDVKFYEPA